MQRREFLQSLTLLSGTSSLILGGGQNHRDSERRLHNLAERFDNTDLTDPFSTSRLRRETERTLAESRRYRSTRRVSLARRREGLKHWIAHVFSFLPGRDAPSNKPKIERNIAAIKRAEHYYEAQKEMLKAAEAIQYELEINESELFRAEDPTIITDLDSYFADLRPFSVRIPPDDEYDLLPNQEEVAAEANALKEIYRCVLRAQIQYHQAVEKIEYGVTLREEREFSAAVDSLNEAIPALIEVPSGLSRYSINRVDLDTYQEIIELYATGAAQMRDSCHIDNFESKRNANKLFSSGLDDLFSAYEQTER